ncbi:hypothetical protein phiPLPE_82 [Iodobacter phage PhiPLPE]|uniref:Uncharacterized protein n=1 Tax=Iodobacter phage PhiPLPE TaxID=551895 RepID=B5AXA1_9CAUD|nr:hypothetical protein phiPLPE_82 [Iodobacter phage PhiPLPE]ACG60404.1 hypothetical protein phiPLPE_82 [Iodobacter phage PhiPLPE]
MDYQDVKINDAELVVGFTDYHRSTSYANIESVHHCDIDITEFIDDGVIGRALIKILDDQHDEETEARAFAKHEDRK